MYYFKLTCGHRVVADFMPMLQYPKDVNYVWCPPCRNGPQELTILGTLKPPNWNWMEIVSASATEMYNVPDGTALIMPNDVLRVQPTVAPNRIRPFPYVNGRR